MPAVRDHAALSCFELDVEGGVAFANYRRVAGDGDHSHTGTPRALRRQSVPGAHSLRNPSKRVST